ncbi:helix-turn-helix domain-containing protein [Marinitenerispora sediminis]|uniref:HTH cro/C1-type domain-containing protein n=1 Tax=Marinitenerispora sediminis TaxID=1931232 RepID=A0A368T7E0_9ACTN|nr:helix-turn-helix transcriptional regulator [Marinitenerispora sediminis]RCV52542.1 hypothetical protein DEF28_12720 [Marinitenerispora sediminis]RCV59501.1 hypothetical protein DEF24_09595 [Marinitenerispora sediminis]RCV59608.1 hypothetical protein DEF23_06950 [Marinitenerispora sediminis]
MDRHPSYSPTVRRRRLSAELRRMREQCGYTTSEVAERAGWTQSKVTKIELGERRNVTTQDLTTLLDVYGIEDERVREALHRLAREAKERGWWSRYRDVFTDSLPDFESEATTIRSYQCQVIPGLLQLPDYTEAVFKGGQVHDPNVVERAVAARLRRQEILNRYDPPTFWAVLDEAAVRRTIGGPEVMRKQLQHLIHMAARHNITIQVIPNSAGAHIGLLGSFVILDFPEPLDPSIAYAETYTASLLLEAPEELKVFKNVFGHLLGSAMSAAESVAFIEDAMTSME